MSTVHEAPATVLELKPSRLLGVFYDVLQVVQRQDREYGTAPRTDLEWLALLVEELGELSRHINVTDVTPVTTDDMQLARAESGKYAEILDVLALGFQMAVARRRTGDTP